MSKLQVNDIVDKDDVSAPGFSKGANITGVCTATSFSGNLTGNVTGTLTGTASGLAGSPDIAVGQVTAGVSTFTGNVLVDGGGSSVNLQFKDTSGAYQRMGIVKDNDKLQLGEYNNAGDTFTDVLTVSGNGDRVIVGHDSNIGGSKLQTNTTGAAAFEATSWYNGADATGVSIRKSRGSTPGDYTVVQDGDGLGSLNFAGADGTDWANGARIKATVNGTPGSNDMPTKLEFFISNDGTENLTERLEVNSSGITVAGTISDSDGTLRSLPVNSQTSAYSLVAADAGKLIKITTGGVTCPNGESFSAGDMISIMNESDSDQTITQGGGATLYWTADGTTGNRTLGARGVATIVMAGSSAFYISGSGLS